MSRPTPAKKSTRAADFVTVACKLPQGLKVKIDEKNIEVHLHGSNSPYAVAGHGLTDVKKDVWDAITEHFAEHKGAKWLHNGTVFAHAQKESASDEAEDRAKVDAGFDQINPNDPSSVHRAVQIDGARDPGEGAA